MDIKIIDRINDVVSAGGTTVSFEFFPAKVCAAQKLARQLSSFSAPNAAQTEAGKENLLRRIEDMTYSFAPTFVTLTWRSAFKVRHLCWLAVA